MRTDLGRPRMDPEVPGLTRKYLDGTPSSIHQDKIRGIQKCRELEALWFLKRVSNGLPIFILLFNTSYMYIWLGTYICLISSRLRYRMTDTKVCMEFHLVPIRIPKEILTVFCAAILMGLTSYISMLLRAKSTSKTENAGNMAYSALFNCHTGQGVG